MSEFFNILTGLWPSFGAIYELIYSFGIFDLHMCMNIWPTVWYWYVTAHLVGNEMKWMVYHATNLYRKAILGTGQLGQIRWILVLIMPYSQNRSLNLLTRSPAPIVYTLLLRFWSNVRNLIVQAPPKKCKNIKPACVNSLLIQSEICLKYNLS